METKIERQIKEDWVRALIDFFKKTNLKEGNLIIIGCSTSEIKGEIYKILWNRRWPWR